MKTVRTPPTFGPFDCPECGETQFQVEPADDGGVTVTLHVCCPPGPYAAAYETILAALSPLNRRQRASILQRLRYQTWEARP